MENPLDGPWPSAAVSGRCVGRTDTVELRCLGQRKCFGPTLERDPKRRLDNSARWPEQPRGNRRLGAPRRRFPRGCSGQRAELSSRRFGSRSRVGPKHFRCPRQRSSTVSVRPTHLPDTAAEGHGPSSGFSMRPQRRTYSKSFKAQVIQECSEPGASIANIALGYSLNAALLNKSNFC